MTHDELLAEIKLLGETSSINSGLANALRTVVELHKPYANPINCRYCNTPYPCVEIQAIEKELE